MPAGPISVNDHTHGPGNHNASIVAHIPAGFVSAHHPDPGRWPLRGWSSYSWQARGLCHQMLALGCAFPPNGLIRACSCPGWDLAGVWDHLCGNEWPCGGFNARVKSVCIYLMLVERSSVVDRDSWVKVVRSESRRCRIPMLASGRRCTLRDLVWLCLKVGREVPSSTLSIRVYKRVTCHHSSI